MGRGGLWGAGGRLFEAERLLTFSASRKGANSRLGAYSDKYGISNDCSGLHEIQTIWIFWDAYCPDISVIAKIRQFCNRFEILILTQLILKMRHSLR